MNATLSVQEIRNGFTVKEAGDIHGQIVPALHDPDRLIVSGIPWHAYQLKKWYELRRVGDGDGDLWASQVDAAEGWPLEVVLMDLAEFIAGVLS